MTETVQNEAQRVAAAREEYKKYLRSEIEYDWDRGGSLAEEVLDGKALNGSDRGVVVVEGDKIKVLKTTREGVKKVEKVVEEKIGYLYSTKAKGKLPDGRYLSGTSANYGGVTATYRYTPEQEAALNKEVERQMKILDGEGYDYVKGVGKKS